MADVEFRDFSVRAANAIEQKALQFLREAGFEVEAETKRNTPTDKAQLKSSWASAVDEGAMQAMIGSPLEQSFWNEFGTGSHAVNGDGRKGWWVYIEGQERGASNSAVYSSYEDAAKAAEWLHTVKKLPAVVTNGDEPNHTLQNAYASKKATIIRMGEEIFKGV